MIGGGEPGLPGISIGHNGQIAFGLTIFAIDQEELYIYELNPDNPREYRYQGRWEPMRVEHETIEVKDGDDIDVELVFTRHGPLVHSNDEKCIAFAVRAAWLEPGMAPYLGSMDYMRAKNWDEFLGAMNRWGAPPENQLYADTDGNIGWKTGGLTPIRPNWDGTLPVPGDGRYEWAGFYDMDELPGDFNPANGWLSTANEMNLPEDFPRERHITYDWYAPYRKHRIDEVLSDLPRASVSDMVALQSDYLSIPARRIMNAVRRLPLEDRSAVDGLALLLDWDNVLDAESAAAALFEVWYRRHLRPALLAKAVGELTGDIDTGEVLKRIANKEDLLADARIDLELMEDPGDRLGPDAAGFLASAVAATVPAAVADLEDLLGTDRSAWAWGRLHVSRVSHPLKAIMPGIDEEKLTAGPLPRGGSGDTVGNTAYGPNFVQSAGSTFRVAIDVGNWDASLAMNAPGQSGNIHSPHFTDLYGMWARGEAFPLLYARDSIEAVAEHIIRLTPPADK